MSGRPVPDRTEVLIGRDAELESLRADLARVADGGSGVVLLSGPPGVGKTGLARAALACAEDLGFGSFAGRCRPFSQDVAYAPLTEAFGPMLRALDAGERARLLGDLGQLGLVFSGVGLRPPEPLGDPELERSRLLDGFTRLVERLARDRPMALLFDDVHLADSASFALVAHLAAGAVERPLLLLLTARPDEPGRQRVGPLLGWMRESPWWLRQVEVAPLDHGDSARLVQVALGSRVDPALTDRIVERSAGRPLFLDALARTVAESGRLVDHCGVLHLAGGQLPLPDDVREQLRGRVAGCGPDERVVLDVLAAAGGDLDPAGIAVAGDLDRDRAATALDRLYRRGLLQQVHGEAGAEGRYELVHALLRDTLNADLAPLAAQRIHARLVELLGARRVEDAQLAEHVLAAGPLIEPGRALRHLVAAARHARSLGDVEAAARYFAPAVELAAVPVADGGRADLLGELLEEHAAALGRAGRPDEASEVWRRALAQATRMGGPGAVARIEQELGMLDWNTGELDAARAHFGNAERALAGLEPSADHAALLYTQTITASRVGDAETVSRTARGLRELAEQLGSPRLVAQAYLAEAVLDYAATDYTAMVQRNLDGLAAAERAGDPLLIIRAHDQLSVAAASQLDLEAMRRHSRASLQVALDLGAVILQPWPRGRLAVADLLGGDWDAALRGTADMAVQALRYRQQRGAVSSAAGYAWALVHRGRLADARRYLDQARAAAKPMLEADRNIFSIVAIADATLALAEGDPQRAVRWAKQLQTTTGGWLPLLGLSILGEARVAAGDHAGAWEAVESLRAVRSCSTVAPEALASWLEAQLCAASGERFREAAGLFERLGLPFYVARAQLAAAEADATCRPKEAIELARTALDTFDALGAPPQAQQARELLRGLGVTPSRGRARTADGPLSARELEVARLVASGMSNADVAAALFISPRTVTTHLDRIYGKLGLSSRVALTRYLADSGLLDAPD